MSARCPFAFPGAPLLVAEAKIGILARSLLPGLVSYAVLQVAGRERSRQTAEANLQPQARLAVPLSVNRTRKPFRHEG